MNIVATYAGPAFAILDMKIMKVLFSVSETRGSRSILIEEQTGTVAGKTDQEALLIRSDINILTVYALQDEGIW